MQIELVALIVFSISQVGTPGPANMALLATGASFGLRRALPFRCGRRCRKADNNLAAWFWFDANCRELALRFPDNEVYFGCLHYLPCLESCTHAPRSRTWKWASAWFFGRAASPSS